MVGLENSLGKRFRQAGEVQVPGRAILIAGYVAVRMRNWSRDGNRLALGRAGQVDPGNLGDVAELINLGKPSHLCFLAYIDIPIA